MKLYYKAILLCALICTPYTQAQNILVSLDSVNIPDVTLGEVIIAASRDNSKIKDIPGSVSSIRTSEIEGNQIQSLEDLSTFAPNFMMLDYGTKIAAPIYIRGIGSKKTTVNPSVGLYVDGIPYFDNSALSFDFYDICQVEVLRGPQGTLYGRNAIGGLVNITTFSPINYQGNKFRISAGEYNTYNATLSHYKRIGDKLAYSLALNYNHQGGYFTNIADSSKADESSSYGFRNRLIYKINESLTIENIAGLEISSQNGYPYGTYTDSTDINDVNYNRKSGYDRTMFNDGLSLNYNNLNIQGQFTIAYHHIDDAQKIDQDFKPKNYVFVDQEQRQDMLTTEAILRSKNKETYNWIAGLFANGQQQDKNVSVNYYAPLNTMYKKDFYKKDYLQQNSSIGLFHQSKMTLGDLTLTAGFRVNNETSNLDYGHFETYKDTITLDSDTTFSTLNEFAFLPKLTIQYKLDNSTLYASYTTGYKPGGFNATFEEKDQIQFTKEESSNFEVGIKTDIINGLIYSDISFFYSNITGQQIDRSLKTSNGTYIDNSGKSENKGIEFALSTAQINGFETSVNYGYTYAKILEYKKDNDDDYSGNMTPYVPNHTLNIMLAQTIQTHTIDYLDNMRVQVNFQQIGDTYWDLNNEMLEDAYNLTNMTVTLNYNKFKLDFWGKNLFDTQYHAYMFKTSSWFGQKGLPRRFGTTLTLEF